MEIEDKRCGGGQTRIGALDSGVLFLFEHEFYLRCWEDDRDLAAAFVLVVRLDDGEIMRLTRNHQVKAVEGTLHIERDLL